MARGKSDDTIFRDAKSKVGEMIKSAETVDDVVALANTLAKLKAVELKMQDEDGGGYGADL